MTGAECKTIFDACDERDLNYSAVTMMPSYINKTPNTVIKVVGENIIGFRRPMFAESNAVNGIEVLMLPVEQLCEIHITGTYDDVIAISDVIGATLTDEDKKILLHIDKYQSHIEPETGDYNRFRYITGKAYELLDDEAKAKYEADKKAYEKAKKNKLGSNQAASFKL